MAEERSAESDAAKIERLEGELYAHMRGCTAWEYRQRAEAAEQALARIVAELDFAEEHKRHIANDEVLVEVGLIRPHVTRVIPPEGGRP